MNILQKFSQFENNDILNKIYSYLGEHPIIEKTNFKKIKNNRNRFGEVFFLKELE